ncbi:anti-sigma-D factor RsdA [Saccharomonospora sp.]|uniref:anti-sigma-D factor RsdA n=1 Tax=Saccharomonospora sp. TaxID=33913 RepID=UPI002606C9ED|nr:anti-sigma-D factor RsdA [Saccharomonospora sp.]
MTERDGVSGDNHETEFGIDGPGADKGSAESAKSAEPTESADSADTSHCAQSSSAGEDAEMMDLSAIQADDALLDALGAADSKVGDELGDQELSALLLAWRRDVDSEAIPELVDTQSAVTTVKTAVMARNARGRGRRRRMLVPVAAAAAVLAIGFTGTALAARGAEPGDTLWGLSKVLYSDHARSVEAAASVRTDLDAADLAIAQERYGDARRALEEAEAALEKVTGEDELARLRARHMELLAQLDQPGQAEQPEHAPPASSSDTSSSSQESRTSTTTDTPEESSQDDVPPELDETSSIPTTEPSTPSTEPTTPTTTPEESPTEESDSRSDTSSTTSDSTG